MNKKIFKSICFATLTVFIATLILIMGALTSYFTNSQKRQLKNETDLAAQGIMLNGKEFFEGMDEKTDYRITWINSDGNVIYDNEADPEKMENHLERDEIKQAFENGYGEVQDTARPYQKNFYIQQGVFRMEQSLDFRLLKARYGRLLWDLQLRYAEWQCLL